MLEEARIDAEIDLVDFSGPESLIEHSRSATIVFLPLRVRGGRLSGPRGQPLKDSLSSLPVCAMVVAGEDIDLEAQPDDAPKPETAADTSNPPSAAAAPSAPVPTA